MSEQLEHQLNLLSKSVVIVVKPGFGTQSESISGYLTTISTSYPIKFHLSAEGINMIFTADDVVKLDSVTDERFEDGKCPVVRLKGPMDYLHVVSKA